MWRAVVSLIFFNLIMIGSALALGAGSPGRQVIYDARLKGDSDIFLLDVAHSLKFNLTRHEGEDSRPVWSPDGRYIAFESWRDGTRAVYVMEASGDNLRRLTTHTDASEYAPKWTADGEAILFRYYKRPDSAIFRARPDGSDLQQIDPGAYNRQSGSQDRVVSTQYVDSGWGIFVTEDGVTRQLTGNDLLYREPLQWSADGQLIAFVSQGEAEKSEIFVMDSDGNALRQITTDGMFKSNLRWRP